MKVWIVTYNNRPPAAFPSTYKPEDFINEEIRLGYMSPEDESEITDTSFFVDDWMRGHLEEISSL